MIRSVIWLRFWSILKVGNLPMLIWSPRTVAVQHGMMVAADWLHLRGQFCSLFLYFLRHYFMAGSVAIVVQPATLPVLVLIVPIVYRHHRPITPQQWTVRKVAQPDGTAPHLPPYWYQFTTPLRWTSTWSPAPWFAASWFSRVPCAALRSSVAWAWIRSATRAPFTLLWSILRMRGSSPQPGTITPASVSIGASSPPPSASVTAWSLPWSVEPLRGALRPFYHAQRSNLLPPSFLLPSCHAAPSDRCSAALLVLGTNPPHPQCDRWGTVHCCWDDPPLTL